MLFLFLLIFVRVFLGTLHWWAWFFFDRIVRSARPTNRFARHFSHFSTFLLTSKFLAAVNKSLKRGVKEVVKALRKSPIPAANAAITIPNGVVVLAADISPMDVISHIPVLCEDHGIPYVFVTSRAELGASAATKRPTSVVMVTPKAAKGKKEDDEEFTKVFEELAGLTQKELKKLTV